MTQTQNKVSLFELENSRQRLQYYTQQKLKTGSKAPKSLDKWIEIYSERVTKLEKQMAKLEKLGLKTALGNRAATAASANGQKLLA